MQVHPQFKIETLENDIAILKLSNTITFNTYIQPICLWDNEMKSIADLENKKGSVMGWGYTEEDDVSDVLKEATMPVISLPQCLQSNRDFFGAFLTDSNFCAGYQNGTSVCNGDSGGAMVFQEGTVWYIRGIVSLAMKREKNDLCNNYQYVIFTDVARYLDWIGFGTV